MEAFQVISIIVCAILMMVKGGQHRKIWNPNLPVLAEWFYDGTQLSALLFAAWCMLFFPAQQAAVCGLGWWLGNMVSLRHEVSAIGGYRGGWGFYMASTLGRTYGLKKGLQRGVWTGALLGIIFLNPLAALHGALFVPAYWLGISYRQWREKRTEVDWDVGEAIFGACIGGLFLWI